MVTVTSVQHFMWRLQMESHARKVDVAPDRSKQITLNYQVRNYNAKIVPTTPGPQRMGENAFQILVLANRRWVWTEPAGTVTPLREHHKMVGRVSKWPVATEKGYFHLELARNAQTIIYHHFMVIAARKKYALMIRLLIKTGLVLVAGLIPSHHQTRKTA